MHRPSLVTTTLVGNVASNVSLALEQRKYYPPLNSLLPSKHELIFDVGSCIKCNITTNHQPITCEPNCDKQDTCCNKRSQINIWGYCYWRDRPVVHQDVGLPEPRGGESDVLDVGVLRLVPPHVSIRPFLKVWKESVRCGNHWQVNRSVTTDPGWEGLMLCWRVSVIW